MWTAPYLLGNNALLKNLLLLVTYLLKVTFDKKKQNKPTAQAAGADPSQWNSTNRQNRPLQ